MSQRKIILAAYGAWEDVLHLPKTLENAGFVIGDTGMCLVPNDDGNFGRDIEILIDSSAESETRQ